MTAQCIRTGEYYGFRVFLIGPPDDEWVEKIMQTAMAGRYAYGEEPDDIYRRHDNCDCTVTFENGRKRQDVWSKREWEAPEPGAGAGEPVVLTKEQAEALQAQNDLTILPRNGTMKSSGTALERPMEAPSE